MLTLHPFILIGGYPKFVAQGFNEDYFPVWLQREGYNTYYTGKLFNAHTIYNYNSPYPGGFTGSVRETPNSLHIQAFRHLAQMKCKRE
jgi:hypothetical protein